MNIIWSPEALTDLEEAIDYLVERSPAAAEKLATGIVTLVERLAAEEIDGPEHILGKGERVRGWPFPPSDRAPEAMPAAEAPRRRPTRGGPCRRGGHHGDERTHLGVLARP